MTQTRTLRGVFPLPESGRLFTVVRSSVEATGRPPPSLESVRHMVVQVTPGQRDVSRAGATLVKLKPDP